MRIFFQMERESISFIGISQIIRWKKKEKIVYY